MKELFNRLAQKIENTIRKNKSSDCLNIVICLSIVIFFFVAMFFTSNGGFSEEEKRNLASFPKLSQTSLKEIFNGSYFSKINDFYEDNFVNREQFLAIYDKVSDLKGLESDVKMTVVQNSSVANVSGTPKNDEAKDSKKEDDSDEDIYTNAEQIGTLLKIDNIVCEAYGVNKPVVEEYAKTIKKFGNTLDKCSVYNILIPTHAEFALPSKYKNLSANQKEVIDLVYSKTGDKVTSVDAYSQLKEHKKEYIYFKSDHHWTQLGAYYAYIAYCKDAGLKPFNLDDFETKKISGFLGTLYAASKEKVLKENPDYVEYRPVGGDLETTIYTKGDLSKSYKAFPYADFCQGSNAYGVFIYGDNPLTVIKNPKIKSNKKVAVVKESYGNAFSPLLTQNYSEVYVVDMRYFKKSFRKFIDDKNIDDVVFINNMMAVGAKSRVDELKVLLNN